MFPLLGLSRWLDRLPGLALLSRYSIAHRRPSRSASRRSRNLASHRTFVLHTPTEETENGSRSFALVDWNSPSDHPSHLAVRRAALTDQPTRKNAGGAACGASCR